MYSGTAIHTCGFNGHRVPIDAEDIVHPENYYDPDWSLGCSLYTARRQGTAPIGYVTSPLSATLVRLAEHNHNTFWTEQSLGPGFLSDIR